MNHNAVLPVIMAGGAGTRLWPLSRESYPKQFLTLQGNLTMLQTTIERLSGLSTVAPLVICNENHRFLVAEQLRQCNALAGNILLEPFGRNTAPAIALAALRAVADGDDPLLLVLAADHVIQDCSAFQAAIRKAIPFAASGSLVAFGIVARTPETGYGYIRRGDPLGDGGFRIAAFIEKPSLEVAKEFVSSGAYDWNSGLFLFKASRYLEELQKFRPDMLEACRLAMTDVSRDMDFIRVNAEAFARCPDDSIDYAVMEKTESAVVVPMDVGWSDVEFFRVPVGGAPKDEDGNVHNGDVLSHQCRNTLVFAENAVVATVGVDDLVVIQTKDAVLVARRDHSQEVKKIVARLKSAGRSEHQTHREVYRPWGKYDSIDHAHRYQVKRITVKPGAKLSVQMHHHRAEHWIVVSGTANVTIDGATRLICENQSVYIPLGAVHALENPGKIPLELIEVQVGPYLGEDDIVRFEDRYGRT